MDAAIAAYAGSGGSVIAGPFGLGSARVGVIRLPTDAVRKLTDPSLPGQMRRLRLGIGADTACTVLTLGFIIMDGARAGAPLT